jgi:NAD(P)-dependent dehydrogenase (short-subunit alcohol dehydrogenase family)
MLEMNLSGKTILVTGAARRVGRAIALTIAEAGADVILHHHHSSQEAAEVADQIHALGRCAWVMQADLANPAQAASLVDRAAAISPLDGLINNAAIFEAGTVLDTPLDSWQQHLAINTTAPFLLSQAFARQRSCDREGRILNILDWRALRPGADHFAYTVSKAALAAMTKSLAISLAPHIQVNGLALGAILPPADGADNEKVLGSVPAARWADLQELEESVMFLMSGPIYITGEIIHLDGGRHLI